MVHYKNQRLGTHIVFELYNEALQSYQNDNIYKKKQHPEHIFHKRKLLYLKRAVNDVSYRHEKAQPSRYDFS